MCARSLHQNLIIQTFPSVDKTRRRQPARNPSGKHNEKNIANSIKTIITQHQLRIRLQPRVLRVQFGRRFLFCFFIYLFALCPIISHYIVEYICACSLNISSTSNVKRRCINRKQFKPIKNNGRTQPSSTDSSKFKYSSLRLKRSYD